MICRWTKFKRYKRYMCLLEMFCANNKNSNDYGNGSKHSIKACCNNPKSYYFSYSPESDVSHQYVCRCV